MMRPGKGILGICLCHLFLLLCQWASASPVETRCAVKSRYEKFWQPVNYLTNKIVSILFKAATFAFKWIPGLRATYVRPEFASAPLGEPAVGSPVAPVVPESADGYCYIKSRVPVNRAYFKYDYQD